ncbi:MAG: efflux RND transporter permease subunit [Nitrosospira sp.]|nr:efflux RND transporter permease subunit [Nitrosospira sp.]MBI0412775.1 efflux RND transporter permease subunit [Nitrosospira sp.]MSQ44484.1 hypothetical protein [Nitrosomonadaceae bacterium]
MILVRGSFSGDRRGVRKLDPWRYIEQLKTELVLHARKLARQFLIFTAAPLAITGGILALWLRDIPLFISAGARFIAMSGVAALDGLVLLSFIRSLREEGMTLEDPIPTGSLLRLRRVLVTTWIETLSFLPRALSTGTGYEVQRTLATVMVGSTLSKSLLTLLVLPVLYQLAHRHDVPSVIVAPQS